MSKFCITVMIVHKKNGSLYATLIAQMVASVTLDMFLGKSVYDKKGKGFKSLQIRTCQ